jgi:hypothetical protein
MKPLLPGSDTSSVDLSAMMEWYASHCNGEWEHKFGISIKTLDNPGWFLKVNLKGTNLEGSEMHVVSEDDNEENPLSSKWIDCWIQDHEFLGACDPTQLPRLISVFSALIRDHSKT